MASQSSASRKLRGPVIPTYPVDIPILYEDDDEGEMGESNPHTTSSELLHICLKTHLESRREYQVFANMNLYYPVPPRLRKQGRLPYVSPDVMVVVPYQILDEDVTSYTIGNDGPAPVLTVEVLSNRSAQQRDKKEKIDLYALLGVSEYILVDSTGRFLPENLMLKRLLDKGAYQDEQDADGGVTSQLGFRLIFDADGKLRIVDTATGKRYARPDEAQHMVEALAKAEKKLRALEADLARLRRKKRPKKDR